MHMHLSQNNASKLNRMTLHTGTCLKTNIQLVLESGLVTEIRVKLEFVFYVKTDVSPPIGVMLFCIESQVLVQQRGINSESK